MINLSSKRLIIAACTTLAAIGSSAPVARADEPSVIRMYEPEIVNTIPFGGCGGEPVVTTFTGWLRAAMVIHPDGSTNLTLKTRELATWQQDGVDYTVDVVFNLNDSTRVGDVT